MTGGNGASAGVGTTRPSAAAAAATAFLRSGRQRLQHACRAAMLNTEPQVQRSLPGPGGPNMAASAAWVSLLATDCPPPPTAGAVAALSAAAGEIRERIDEQVQSSAEVAQVVAALERQYDAFIDAQENRSLLARDEDLPSGDELGAAFEKFLAQQGKKFDDDDKG